MVQSTGSNEEAKKVRKGMGFMGVLLTALVVSLIVSIGSGRFILPWLDEIFVQKIEVPDLAGSKMEHAKLMLEGKGLFTSVVGESYDEKIPAGYVASHTPQAGSLIDKKSTVSLVISKGRQKVTVPVLMQLPAEEAKTQIVAIGLKVGEIESRQSSLVPQSRIIESKPPAGSELYKGDPVDLVVSAGVKVVTVFVPNLKKKSLTEAQNILARSGLFMGKIIKRSEETADFDIILDQNPPAGARVTKGSSVSITINAEEDED